MFRTVGLLSLAVLIVIALFAACGRESTDDRSGELRAAALELVPDDSRVLSTRTGACVELAPVPSCVTSFFRVPAGRLEDRVAAVRAAGRAGGWDERLIRVGSGGGFLRLRRQQFDASVLLRRLPRPFSCAGGRVEDCADNVHVVLAG